MRLCKITTPDSAGAESKAARFYPFQVESSKLLNAKRRVANSGVGKPRGW